MHLSNQQRFRDLLALLLVPIVCEGGVVIDEADATVGTFLTKLGPSRPSAGGPSRIVVRIQLHTPRLAPAALASVEVSGNRGKNPLNTESV